MVILVAKTQRNLSNNNHVTAICANLHSLGINGLSKLSLLRLKETSGMQKSLKARTLTSRSLPIVKFSSFREWVVEKLLNLSFEIASATS